MLFLKGGPTPADLLPHKHHLGRRIAQSRSVSMEPALRICKSKMFVSSLCNREVQAGGGREPPGQEVRKFAAAAVHWRAAPLSSFLRKVNFIFTSPRRGRGSNKRLLVSVLPAHPGVQTTRAGGSGGGGLRGRQLGLQASAGWRQAGKAGTLPTPHPKGRPEGRKGGRRLAARGSNALAIPSVGQVFTACFPTGNGEASPTPIFPEFMELPGTWVAFLISRPMKLKDAYSLEEKL
ncbi:uncharacterized protein LOC133239765 [Bos javanicus]|uniref:uncharacterized protein LOC133239765 n=1 Tax=Bos javanicus TaxID=9906 RepID=UPI002AA8ECE6|nr:uncharacterized protein LOC133239765 [Bos javanicus]